MAATPKILQRCAAAFPVLAPAFASVGELHQRKQYHQMTETLLELVKNKGFAGSPLVRELFEEFLAPLGKTLNGRSFAQFAVLAARQHPTLASASEFLTAISNDLRPKSDDSSRAVAQTTLSFVWVYPLTEIARLKLAAGDRSGAKALLEEVGAVLESIVEMDSVLHSFYYLVKAEYHKQHGPAEAFCRNALLYLTCKSLDEIAAEEKTVLAFELCLAALVSDRMYTFGALLGHEVLKSLGPHDWIADLLRAIHAGNFDAFNEIKQRRAARMNTQRALVLKQELLDEKVAMAALIELLFRLPADNRTVSFGDIAARTRRSVDAVETLVMRLFSLELAKGVIDDVSQTVSIAWLAPRVLDMAQIQSLDEQLLAWTGGVDTALALVEAETPELFAA